MDKGSLDDLERQILGTGQDQLDLLLSLSEMGDIDAQVGPVACVASLELVA